MKRVDLEALRQEQVALDGEVSSTPSQGTAETLTEIDGVEGYGFDGRGHVVVYVRSESVRARVPSTVDGMPVRCEVTGAVSIL